MTDGKQQENKAHAVSLEARKNAHIVGVSEVQSFDEESVVLTTSCGEMTVEGEGLHVGTLDMAKGVVSIDGDIRALYYTDGAPSRRRGRRLFS